MPRLLVFQHVPFEILGTLNPLFKRSGFRIRYVNFGRHPDAEPSLEGYDGLVVLGGPMSVSETRKHRHLTTELRVIEEAIQRDFPVLGVCLGAQLIAKALGSRVWKNGEKEIGWYDVSRADDASADPVVAPFKDSEKVFQWHGDTFEIPRGGVHLASSPACSNQAFRMGEKVYGFQFHLEVDEPLIERWLKTASFKEEIESLGGKVTVEGIRRDTKAHIHRLTRLSQKCFGAFIGLFGGWGKNHRLPSR
jgi:GMP synthase (glutamine-hydrolysing)